MTSYPSKALLDSGELLASFPGSGVLGGVFFFSFGKLFYGTSRGDVKFRVDFYETRFL